MAFYQCAVENQREPRSTDESEILSHIKFQPETVGVVGVFIRIDQVGAACHGVGPFNGFVEKLAEQSHTNNLIVGRIPLISQVDIINATSLQVGIALHISGEVEIIIYRR